MLIKLQVHFRYFVGGYQAMKKLKWQVPLFLAFFGFSQAHGYSTISEALLNVYLSSPLDLVPSSAAGNAKINLLKWNDNLKDPPVPTERYDRIQQFGTWITLNQSADDCIDVRNRVLMRESAGPIEMRKNNPCKVGTGKWYDAHTDKVYTNSQDLQIDHFVPLKDTYTNGAWKWNYQARCAYGNYMGYRDHLKPVESKANMSKSDSHPGDYLPDNQAYRCEYLKTWLSIKLIWKLGMQRDEAQAIKNLIAQERCNPSQFTFSTAELQAQRGMLVKMLEFCPETPPPPQDWNNKVESGQ